MTRCDQYERLISDGLDRQLSQAEQAELQEHLRGCEACREFQTSVMACRELLRALPVIETSLGVKSSAVKRGESALARIWNKRLSVPLPVAAGIGLLLVSLAAFSAFHRAEAPQVIEPVPTGSIDYVQVEVVPASAAKPLEPQSHINKR